MRTRIGNWIRGYAHWLMMEHKWAYLLLRLANKIDNGNKATVIVKSRYSR